MRAFLLSFWISSGFSVFSLLVNTFAHYPVGPSTRTGVVFSVDYLNSISSGKPPLLSFSFVPDWGSRAPGVRLEEILRSDYLFFEEDGFAGEIPPKKRSAKFQNAQFGDRLTSPVKIETFDQEISAYGAWLRSLDEQHGVSWVKRAR